MKARCDDPNNIRWDEYGGRGITYCSRWDDYDAFVEDMGYRPEGMTLDRKKVSGNYTPRNCQWATQEQQDNNRRHCRKFKFKGESLTLAQISRRTGIGYANLRRRVIYCGMSIRRATRL